MSQPTCKQRWLKNKNSVISDLRKLWSLYCRDPDSTHHDLGNFQEYGLSFDYVDPKTFKDQGEGYWRYQISWGGPSEEFRFFSSGPRYDPYRVEYWFLDWWDGHGRALQDKDLELLLEIWSWFQDIGSTESEFEKASEEQ